MTCQPFYRPGLGKVEFSKLSDVSVGDVSLRFAARFASLELLHAGYIFTHIHFLSSPYNTHIKPHNLISHSQQHMVPAPHNKTEISYFIPLPPPFSMFPKQLNFLTSQSHLIPNTTTVLSLSPAHTPTHTFSFFSFLHHHNFALM